jgi:outer membrane lipoprotein-sorting protein
MVLRNRHGEERVRQMRIRILEGMAGGDRTLLVFDRPRDLSGTALLTHANPGASDDQWLYLPALKRVKRIATSSQSGSFMGSEFAYEDIGSQEVGKYRYRFHGEDTLDQQACLVVERVPLDSSSGYSRQLVWFDREAYRVLQIEYYDPDGDRLKTLRLRGYQRYDQHWRPDEMEMVNSQTGKSTTIVWQEYEFDSGLSERDFDRSALHRAR